MNRLINTHFNIDLPDKLLLELPDVERIHDIMYNGIRQDLGWSAIERPRLRYDLRAVDMLAKELLRLKMTMMPILCYGNNHVYQGDPNGHTGPSTPEQRMAFVNYGRLLMSIYKNRSWDWEIWNEPNHPQFWRPKPNYDDYILLLREFTTMAYNCFRGESIIAPAISTKPGTDGAIDMEWLERLTKETSIVAKLKGISVHAHRHRPPQTIIAEIEAVKKLFPKKKIIVSEWGYPREWLRLNSVVTTGLMTAEEHQADHLRRSFAAAEKAGCYAMVYYNWSDYDKPDPMGWNIKGTDAEKALVT